MLFRSLGIRGSDVSMQRLVLSWQRLTVLASHLALLDTALASDDDLGSGVLLHVLQSVSSWSNQQAHKVDVRMIVLGNHHFVTHFDLRSPRNSPNDFGSISEETILLVIGRGLVIRVDEHHLLDAVMPHLLQLFPLPVLSRVQSLAIGRVDGLRRG